MKKGRQGLQEKERRWEIMNQRKRKETKGVKARFMQQFGERRKRKKGRIGRRR